MSTNSGNVTVENGKTDSICFPGMDSLSAWYRMRISSGPMVPLLSVSNALNTNWRSLNCESDILIVVVDDRALMLLGLAIHSLHFEPALSSLLHWLWEKRERSLTCWHSVHCLNSCMFLVRCFPESGGDLGVITVIRTGWFSGDCTALC